MTTQPARPQPCVVIRFNHLDPVWRRCWDRDIADRGQRVVSYRAIEEACIGDAVASCADGVSCFMVETAWVLRHYLERHPEHAPVLRQMTGEGRFELLGSGETIMDTNMIHGELLCRNLILGTLWGEQSLGQRPTTGWVEDTFGTSAQLPQIFRECGYRWLGFIIYSIPDGPYWRGLDGSVIFTHREDKDRLATYYAGAGFGKHPPCPDCGGHGCPACRGRGFADGTRAEFAKPPLEPKPFAAGAMWLYGEEILPGLHVAEAVAKFQQSQPRFTVRQGTFRDVGEFVADNLTAVDDPPEDRISSRVENNPAFTGCYVTRIRVKQAHRAAEHALMTAERWDALLNRGAHTATLRAHWRTLCLTGFHDAITGTHSDEAFTELMDMLRAVRAQSDAVTARVCAGVVRPQAQAFTLFNSGSRAGAAPVRVSVPERWEGAVVTREGQPLPVYEVAATDRGTEICFLSGEVPAFGAATVRVAALAPCRLAAQGRGNAPCTGGRFTATPAEHGITDLAVTGLGPVTDPAKYLLGELILEADHGGPWATFSPDRPRTRLGPLARLEGVRAHGDSVAITYGGAHPGGDDLFAPLLRWRQIFRLREGLAWLEVETTVEWYTIGCRLRLAFPSTTRLNRGVYEIPCGVLGRDRYDAPNDWFQSCGDWPALHWAGIQAPDHVFAVFNRGTPSYRVEDGTILVSVLRSPRWFMAETPRQAVPLENDDFAARHYDGRLDHGTHTFHHALYVTPGEWRESDVAGQAHLFNAGLHVQPCELAGTLPAWRLEARHTSVAAVKQAEDGQGLVVRLVEHAGRPETVRLHVPAPWRSAWQANLLEDKWRALDVAGGAVEVEMQPWKIVTLRLEG